MPPNDDDQAQVPAELESVYAIAQDKGDGDCGPTCATFLRYGGHLASGPPMEGENRVTRDEVRDMANMMREQIRRSYEENRSSNTGFSPDSVAETISEFAPVHDGYIYRGKYSKDWIPTANRPLVEEMIHVLQKMNEYLAHDPRGVIVPMFSTLKPAIEAYQNPKTRASASAHWVTYLGSENEDALIYNPGDREIVETYAYLPLKQLTFSHIWYCSSLQRNEVISAFMAEPQGSFDEGFTSYLVYGTRAPGSPHETQATRTAGSPYILAGDNIGEIDMKSSIAWPNAQDLIAQENATYYYSYKTADVAAEALSETTSVAVIECPEGLFAVVAVNDLGTALATGESWPDVGSTGSSEDSFLKKNWREMASLSLHLAYDEEGERKIKKKTLEWPDSHRKNY